MHKKSALLGGIVIWSLLCLSPAQARECGKKEQAVFEEIAPVLDSSNPNGERAPSVLSGWLQQDIAELRLARLRSCSGALGFRAHLLTLHLRFVGGEVHALLPEVEPLRESIRQAKDGRILNGATMTSLLEEVENFALGLSRSDRLADRIELRRVGSGSINVSEPALESDGPIVLEATIRDRAGRIVEDIAWVSLSLAAGSASLGSLSSPVREKGRFRTVLSLGKLSRSVTVEASAHVQIPPLVVAAVNSSDEQPLADGRTLQAELAIRVLSLADEAAQQKQRLAREQRERDAAKKRASRRQEQDRQRAVQADKDRRREAIRRAGPDSNVSDFPLLVLSPGLSNIFTNFTILPQIGFSLQGSLAPTQGPGRFIGTFKYNRSVDGYDWLWLAVGAGVRSPFGPPEVYVGFLLGGAGRLLHGYEGASVGMFITGGTFGFELRDEGSPVSLRLGLEWGFSPNYIDTEEGAYYGLFWVSPNINLSILLQPVSWR